MKLIVGLGNPGKKYDGTRHNIGFMAVEKLAEQLAKDSGVEVKWELEKNLKRYRINTVVLENPKDTIKSESLIVLLEPLLFMNESGTAVEAARRHYQQLHDNDIWVVHDDLDLPFGRVRVSLDSSSAGHRGVQSIIESLGSQKFHRLRLGIGRPPEKIPAEAFVLQPFTGEERKNLDGIITLAAATLQGYSLQPT